MPIFTGLQEIGSGFVDTDATLGTCSPAEATVRNRIHFSNLQFSFPTTSPEKVRLAGALRTNRLIFPAYLKSFSESYNVNWGKEEQVYGRADPIPVYSNTRRDITMGFLIPCYDSKDANENLKKVNRFIKNLYPGYVRTKGGSDILNTPPLVRVKFANLLVNHTNPSQGLLGYIKTFNHNFGIKERGVLMESRLLQAGFLAPRVIDFDIAFTVLHEGTVGWDSDKPDTFIGGNEFPYRTNTSLGDATAPAGEGIGMGFAYAATKILDVLS
tara:strand:+ start:5238 stop:6047 length:810 start_codon:yes stop_codon:yes gene_type:complete